MDSKAIVMRYVSEVFGARDAVAVDRWVHPNYIQHNVGMKDGSGVVRKIVRYIRDDFRIETHRVVASDNMVALQSTYHGLGPEPVVVFDIFRVDDGRIVEHWDAFRKCAGTVGGHTTTDGPTEIVDRDRTDENRRLVAGFIEHVLVSEITIDIADYINIDRFRQHNPYMNDGVDGFMAGMATLATMGKKHVYEKLHIVVAEGNFVITVSEGRRGEVLVAFYDLFRVDDGKIVEHWDAVLVIPDNIPHNNGAF